MAPLSTNYGQEAEALTLANPVRETRRRLGLSQAKFAARLGMSFHGRTKPLPVALKQIQHLLHQMGKAGEDLLIQYFPD